MNTQINEYLFGTGIQSIDVPLDKPASERVIPRPKKKKSEVVKEIKEMFGEEYEPLPEYVHRIHAVYSEGAGRKKTDTFEVKTPIRHPYGAYDIVKKQLKNKGYNVHSLEHGGSREAGFSD